MQSSTYWFPDDFHSWMLVIGIGVLAWTILVLMPLCFAFRKNNGERLPW